MGNIGIRLADEIEARIRHEALESGLTLSEYCRSKLAESEEVKPLDRAELSARIDVLERSIESINKALASMLITLNLVEDKLDTLTERQSADLNKIADTSAKLNSNMNELIKVQTLNQHQMMKELGMSTCVLEAFISISTKSEDSSSAWIDKMMRKALDIFNERYLAPKQEGD